MPTERAIVDAYTRRALLLMRVGSGLGAAAERELRELATELRTLLVGVDLSTLGRRDMAALLRAINQLIEDRYASILAWQSGQLDELAYVEAEWAADTAGSTRGASDAAIAAAIAGLLLFGLPLSRHWRRQSTNLSDRVAAAIRTAQASGQPMPELIEAIVGQGGRSIPARVVMPSVSSRERGGIMGGARQQAKTLADTSAHEAAYAARKAAWKAAGIKYLKWHSILDTRTTLGCAARAGKIYDLDFNPVGHDIPMGVPPAAHWNCRSILVAMAPDYVPPGDGQDPYSESLDDWLKRQPDEMQDEMLGEGKANAWRAGTITTRDLLGQHGQILTLEELREAGKLGAA